MTRLERDHEVRRVVATARFGDLVVRVREEGIYLSEKGRRKLGPLGWADLYVHIAGLKAGRKKPGKASWARLKVGV